MTRMPVPEDHGPYIDLDHEPFSAADVGRIVAEVAFPLVAPFEEVRLRDELCKLAQYHHVLIRAASSPTEATNRNYLVALNRAATKMMELIPLNDLPKDRSPDDFEAGLRCP
jgi:hypothetical protein